MCVYLHTKFQVSGICLTPTSKRTPKKPTQIWVNKKRFNKKLRRKNFPFEFYESETYVGV